MRSVGWVAGEVEVLGGGGGGWVKPKLKATKCGLEEHRAGGWEVEGGLDWGGAGAPFPILTHPTGPRRKPFQRSTNPKPFEKVDGNDI